MPLTHNENESQQGLSEQEAMEKIRKAKEEREQRIEEAKARARARAEAAKPKTYTIQAGDTLGKIAQAQYGDGSRWKEIWEANKSEIPDPDTIQVGQEIVIP